MAPPMLPHMFMAPETVPAQGPPISIAAAQEQGMERSLAKLETPIARTASTGDSMRVESSRNPAPAMNPTDATVRRARAALAPGRARRAAAARRRGAGGRSGGARGGREKEETGNRKNIPTAHTRNTPFNAAA